MQKNGEQLLYIYQILIFVVRVYYEKFGHLLKPVVPKFISDLAVHLRISLKIRSCKAETDSKCPISHLLVQLDMTCWKFHTKTLIVLLPHHPIAVNTYCGMGCRLGWIVIYEIFFRENCVVDSPR